MAAESDFVGDVLTAAVVIGDDTVFVAQAEERVATTSRIDHFEEVLPDALPIYRVLGMEVIHRCSVLGTDRATDGFPTPS